MGGSRLAPAIVAIISRIGQSPTTFIPLRHVRDARWNFKSLIFDVAIPISIRDGYRSNLYRCIENDEIG